MSREPGPVSCQSSRVLTVSSPEVEVKRFVVVNILRLNFCFGNLLLLFFWPGGP